MRTLRVLKRHAGHLLTEDVVVGVEEGQLLHHGLLGDEVEHLRDLAVLDDGHAAHRVLPLHPVQYQGVVGAAGAADAPQGAEAGQGGHGDGAAELPCPAGRGAQGVQRSHHKTQEDWNRQPHREYDSVTVK